MANELFLLDGDEKFPIKVVETYHASGLVYGRYWGGGEGAYKAISVKAGTIDELDEKIEQGIADGSLDDGMGYEKLIGAIMTVTIATKWIVNGDEFIKEESSSKFYGDMTAGQEEFLTNAYWEL